MSALLVGIVAVVVVSLLVRGFMAVPAASLATGLRVGGGVFLLLGAVVAGFARRFDLAVLLAVFGVALLRRRGLTGFGPVRSAPTPGRVSTVRSAALEMELDHDSGDLRGRVLAGEHEGRELGDLSMAELFDLHREVRGDGESRALLEAYLDRRFPGWREDLKADPHAGHGGPLQSGVMSDEEAYQVLGLEPGAGEADIREAHRRLMMAVHPDRGGSTFLAAKINEAKDRLIDRHRSSP